MPIPVPPPSYQPIKAFDLVRSAMLEINTIAANETPNAGDAGWGLEKLQRLIDKLNAIRQAIYGVTFTEFTLIPNHAPHTIGPTGDFVITPRPVRIPYASFILNPGQGANEVDAPPINIRDAAWWASLPTKNLPSSVVTDLYYDPAVPNGNLNFWPICTLSNPVRLETYTSLVVPITLTTQLTYPTGYWDAIVLTLASELCSAFGVPADTRADVGGRARLAMSIIMGNNAKPPRIRTDSSMPNSGNSGRPDFDFLTGLNDN